MTSISSNKLIAQNSIILYSRLAITSICGLFTTRFALKALGETDFGLFAVVGGIISIISIINTIMLSTTNRFMATSIAKDSASDVNKVFNVNLFIFLFIAVISLILALPLGKWYILHYLQYSGNINNVLLVFQITMIGSIISFIGVPFNGLLLAKEKFFVFCTTDVLSSLFKVFASYFLINHFTNKLFVYALIISLTTAYPTIVFIIYCRKCFPDIVRLSLVREKTRYIEVFKFSIWVGYGAIASVGKIQGSAILVNRFFSTVLNASFGIANSVNSILQTFASNITKSMSPQITKSYAAGDINRSLLLVKQASKISFSIMLLISSPFIIQADYIYTLWLGDVPANLKSFTILLIIDNLISSLNAGIPELIFATGKIRNYQLTVNSFYLSSLFLGYLLLKFGFSANSLIYSYIFISIIVLLLRQYILNSLIKEVHINLFSDVILPSCIVLFLFLPIIYLQHFLHPMLHILITLIYLSLLIYFIEYRKEERDVLRMITKRFFHK